jgi:hypothetical protein
MRKSGLSQKAVYAILVGKPIRLQTLAHLIACFDPISPVRKVGNFLLHHGVYYKQLRSASSHAVDSQGETSDPHVATTLAVRRCSYCLAWTTNPGAG